MVFIGQFTGLYTPENLFHLVITMATKRALAITIGSIFSNSAVVGITI
jgi:nitrate reductase gamma subunit